MVATATGTELLMRVEEVAQTLRLSRATTYRLIQRGEIPTIRIGTARRVTKRALERWIADQSAAAGDVDSEVA